MSSARCGILVGVMVLLAACGDDGPGGSGGSADSSSDGANLDCGNETLPTYLIIEDEDDLAALDGIRVIQGELQINRTSFANLDFLGCIEEVQEEFTIFGNTELTDLSGLDRLERLGAGFIFSENAGTTELGGLAVLTEIGGSVIIQGNSSLTGISGMTSVSTIGGALNIRDNDLLEHIDGLRGLRTLGTQFAVTHNPSLCISSVNQVGAGITNPAQPGDNWSTRANDDSC